MKRRREARCALSSLFNQEAMLQISRELASVRAAQGRCRSVTRKAQSSSVFQD
jgi:hypothetical protein